VSQYGHGALSTTFVVSVGIDPTKSIQPREIARNMLGVLMKYRLATIS
jgi:hypothetical protein